MQKNEKGERRARFERHEYKINIYLNLLFTTQFCL